MVIQQWRGTTHHVWQVNNTQYDIIDRTLMPSAPVRITLLVVLVHTTFANQSLRRRPLEDVMIAKGAEGKQGKGA